MMLTSLHLWAKGITFASGSVPALFDQWNDGTFSTTEAQDIRCPPVRVNKNLDFYEVQ
jgi:hypothetical protein